MSESGQVLLLYVASGGTATSNVTLNLDPASNPYDAQSLDVAVSTNNSTGYVLTMSSADGGTNLTNVADNTKIIPTLSSAAGSTPSTLTNNTWGYKKDSGNYSPFVTNTTILSNVGRTNEDATTLSFAAKVDYTKPSGLYKQELVFTATPNIATYYMQDLDSAVCTKDPIEAIDLRDNQSYWVAELDDGNCWMLQNLRLGTTANSIALTPANTNISANYTLNNKVSGGAMPSSAITDDVTGNTAHIYDGNAFYCTPDGTNSYVGCYYNWYTATAGSGTSNVTGKNTTGIDVNESICPKGWVIPKAGTGPDNNFQNLYEAMGSPAPTEMLVSPTDATDNASGTYKPGFLLSGRYASTDVGYLGTNGYYWSRTVYSSGHTYFLTASASAFNSSQYGGKYNGRSIRCLRETRTLLDIDNMQDISPAIVGNTNVGAFKQLKDTRDSQYYTVGKLEDGNIWMLDNLNIDLFANKNVISPSNTHITGTVGINGLNAFNGTSVGTASDRYATGAIASTNSDASGNWTSTYSYSVPLQNRSGISGGGSTASILPYNGSNYTYNTVIDMFNLKSDGTIGTAATDVANIYYNIGVGKYEVGTYYNYCAASLGTYCYGSGTSAGTASGNAVEADICPLGWRMPTGGASGEYQTLAAAIQTNHSSTWDDSTNPYSLQSLLSTPFSGYYRNGESGRQGVYGFFWSSTYDTATRMLDLRTSGNGVEPLNYAERNFGRSIRCLAR